MSGEERPAEEVVVMSARRYEQLIRNLEDAVDKLSIYEAEGDTIGLDELRDELERTADNAAFLARRAERERRTARSLRTRDVSTGAGVSPSRPLGWGKTREVHDEAFGSIRRHRGWCGGSSASA